MQIVTWKEWLDQRIPYYESQKYKNIYQSNEPLDVLIIIPSERNTISIGRSFHRLDWELLNEKILNTAKGKVEPLFLERDTKQEWYWAFWKKGDAFFINLSI